MSLANKALIKKDVMEKAEAVYKSLAEAFKNFKASLDKLREKADQLDLHNPLFQTSYANSYNIILSDLVTSVTSLLQTRKTVIGDDGSLVIHPVNEETNDFSTEIWYGHTALEKCKKGRFCCRERKDCCRERKEPECCGDKKDCCKENKDCCKDKKKCETERRFPPRVVCKYDNFSVRRFKDASGNDIGIDFLIGDKTFTILDSSNLDLDSLELNIRMVIEKIASTITIASFLQEHCLLNANIIHNYEIAFIKLYLSC